MSVGLASVETMSDSYGWPPDLLAGWLRHLDDVSPMLRLAEPYAEGLRSGKPVAPMVKFDMAIVSDLGLIIDATLGQHGESGGLRPRGDMAPLPEAEGAVCSGTRTGI